MPERRRSLTPLEAELRAQQEAPITREPSLLERLRRRREKRPPTTLAGVIARGLIRLAFAVGVASGVAFAVDHWTGRNTAFGFYVVGAAVLAIAFLTSASDLGTPYYYRRGDREQRIRMSFAYMLAGALVVAIGVAIELL